MFCSNGPIADLAVVYALTDKAKGYHGGITAFLVPCDAPGFSVGQPFEKMGLRTSPIGELLFEDVYVPDEHVIGRVGGGAPVFAESMDWDGALRGALHVGTSEERRVVEEGVSMGGYRW